ncbi:MAG: TonB-dependent receptor, partial [Flavobacterium sp.]
YNTFKNQLNSYDDATFSKISRPYAFRSVYNDHTIGASAIFENTSLENNSLSLAAHYKKDVHREYNIGEPSRRSADNNLTFGLEDTYQFTSKLKANVGLSFMNRSNDGVEQYNSTTAQISTLPYNSNNAWNLQGLVQYELSDKNNLSLSVARKTRFATIKDRYSYRMGTAIPNPDLKAENALNYDLSYHGNPSDKLSLSLSGFYSKIDNSIQMISNVTRDPISNNNLAQVQNVGKAEYYGFEAGLSYQVLPNLNLDANYTRIIRNNLSAPQIKFTDVPGNKIFASVSYYVLPWVSILASEEYNSNRFSTSYGTKAGSFYLTNAKVNVALKHGISIEGGVNNAFDRNYRLVEGFPEAGRNYFANLIFNY